MTEEKLERLAPYVNSAIKEIVIYEDSNGVRYDSKSAAQWAQNRVTNERLLIELKNIRRWEEETDVLSDLINYAQTGTTNILKGAFYKYKNHLGKDKLSEGQQYIKDGRWGLLETLLWELSDKLIAEIDTKYPLLKEMYEN